MKNINKLSIEDLVVLSARRGLRVDVEKIKNYYNYFDSIDKKDLDEFYIGFLLAEVFPGESIEITKELASAMESLWYKYFSIISQNVLNDIYVIENNIEKKNWR